MPHQNLDRLQAPAPARLSSRKSSRRGAPFGRLASTTRWLIIKAVLRGSGGDVEFAQIRLAQLAPEARAAERPGRRHAVLAHVPVAAAGHPDGVWHRGPHEGIEAVGGGGCRTQCLAASAAHQLDAAQDVVNLRFGNADRREIADRALRAEREEEVRKARHRDRSQRIRSVLPGFAEALALRVAKIQRTEIGMGIEAGGQRQHIDFMQHAIAGHDTASLDVVDVVVDQRHVAALDRWIELGAHHQALAQRLEVRCQLLAQHRVIDLGQIPTAQPAHQPALPAWLDHRRGEQVLERHAVDVVDDPRHPREHAQQRFLDRRIAPIRQWKDPLRRALEHLQLQRSL